MQMATTTPGPLHRSNSAPGRQRSSGGTPQAPVPAALPSQLRERLEAVEKVHLAKELQHALTVTQAVTAQLFEQLEKVEKASIPCKPRPRSAAAVRSPTPVVQRPASAGAVRSSAPALQPPKSADTLRGPVQSAGAATEQWGCRVRDRPQSAGAAPGARTGGVPPGTLRSSAPVLQPKVRPRSAGSVPAAGSALRVGSTPEEFERKWRHRELRLHSGAEQRSAWEDFNSRLQALEQHHRLTAPDRQAEQRLPTPSC